MNRIYIYVLLLLGSMPVFSEEKVDRFSYLTAHKKQGSLELFLSLPLGEEDKILISELLEELSSKTIYELLCDQERLLEIKDLLKPVHPLRILAFIFEEPILKRLAREIERSDAKWVFLTSGLARAMKRKSEEGLLLPYVSGFSQILNLDKDTIQSYIDQKAYGSLFHYLVRP